VIGKGREFATVPRFKLSQKYLSDERLVCGLVFVLLLLPLSFACKAFVSVQAQMA